jgi:hypothetical protein
MSYAAHPARGGELRGIGVGKKRMGFGQHPVSGGPYGIARPGWGSPPGGGWGGAKSPRHSIPELKNINTLIKGKADERQHSAMASVRYFLQLRGLAFWKQRACDFTLNAEDRLGTSLSRGRGADYQSGADDR